METQGMMNTQWQRIMNFNISLYLKTNDDGEKFYEQFCANFDRIYQLLFNLQNYNSTNGLDKWTSLQVDSVIVNEYEGNEEDIEGLNVMRLDFSCLINRSG